jgi:hypothetical protein
MFETLNWWSRLAGQPAEHSMLIYAGQRAYTQNNISIKPWYSI